MIAGADRRRTYRLVMAALVAALVVVVLVSSVVGAAGLSVGEALRALGGLLVRGGTRHRRLPDWAPRLLLDLRLPRIVLALIVGAALSTAGRLVPGRLPQPAGRAVPARSLCRSRARSHHRHRLEDPSPRLGIYAPPAARLRRRDARRLPRLPAGHLLRTHTAGASLLLSGVAVGSTLTAIMSFLMVATERDLHTVVVWLMGGLTTATWTKVLHHPAGGSRRLHLHDAHVAAA